MAIFKLRSICWSTSDNPQLSCFHSVCSTETLFLWLSAKAETVLYSGGYLLFVSEDMFNWHVLCTKLFSVLNRLLGYLTSIMASGMERKKLQSITVIVPQKTVKQLKESKWKFLIIPFWDSIKIKCFFSQKSFSWLLYMWIINKISILLLKCCVLHWFSQLRNMGSII